MPGQIAIVDCDTTRHRYGSFRFSYEDPRHPALAVLRGRLKLDDLLEGARGDFERINRVRHHVSSLWRHSLPEPDYPAWNALDVLDRNERLGSGGMCMQFSLTFIQALQALGYHARHVNLFAHETVEVYVDELGKWVCVDPESLFDAYEYHTGTGLPLHALEQHDYFLRRYGFSAATPIDWLRTSAWAWPDPKLQGEPQPLAYSTLSGALHNRAKPPPPLHRLAGFVRIIPRNDFLSRPTPRPLNQGLRCHWPWNGYLNWYDAATPRTAVRLAQRSSGRFLSDLEPGRVQRHAWRETWGDRDEDVYLRPQFRDLRNRHRPARVATERRRICLAPCARGPSIR